MEIEVVIFFELRCFFLYLSPLFFPVFVFFLRFIYGLFALHDYLRAFHATTC